jgi:hypothetical protein
MASCLARWGARGGREAGGGGRQARAQVRTTWGCAGVREGGLDGERGERGGGGTTGTLSNGLSNVYILKQRLVIRFEHSFLPRLGAKRLRIVIE